MAGEKYGGRCIDHVGGVSWDTALDWNEVNRERSRVVRHCDSDELMIHQQVVVKYEPDTKTGDDGGDWSVVVV